jgi:uncharacterized protein
MKNANPVSRAVQMIVWICACGLVTGCARGSDRRATTAVQPVGTFFAIKVGAQTVQMQLAVTMPEMQRGLMERRDLAVDAGMLFLYERPQKMSFWMRNTPTALDIGFFDVSGRLVEIYPLYPLDETPVVSRSEGLLFALEVNQGWFAKNGVKPGAQLELKALAEALRARGASPRVYGLVD